MNTVHEYLQEARHDRRLRRTTHHYISDMIEYFGRPKVFEGCSWSVRRDRVSR